jgi:hypothetical protein
VGIEDTWVKSIRNIDDTFSSFLFLSYSEGEHYSDSIDCYFDGLVLTVITNMQNEQWKYTIYSGEINIGIQNNETNFKLWHNYGVITILKSEVHNNIAYQIRHWVISFPRNVRYVISFKSFVLIFHSLSHFPSLILNGMLSILIPLKNKGT